MSDIRKKKLRNGTVYQVRFRDLSTKSGYGYRSFPTRKEATAFLESGRLRVRRQRTRPDSGIRTVHHAIDRWLQVCEKVGREDRDPVSPATLDNYRWRAETMKRYPWPCTLQDLTQHEVKAFRTWLKEHCEPDKARKVLSSFHSVMIEMKTLGVIKDDPAEKVTLKHNSRTREPVRIPSIEEFTALLQAADRLANSKNNEIAAAWERYRPMIYLAADTGMRPQEYLALPPEGLGDTGVEVLQALDRSNRIGPPKTRAGRRFIPTGQESLSMAKHYANRHGTSDFVFPMRLGGSIQRYNVYMRNGFHRLIDEAGLVERREVAGKTQLVRSYTPYSLRHFFASMLIEQNKSAKYIQTVMGHEDITLTYNVYGHLIRKKETERLEDEGGVLRYVRPTETCGGFVAADP